ncbi:MAG TPA: diacylglycerol kinase family protein, partial [Opitutaceae bacterium]|nr:diacylglycerol kinase family protein [Opitutaceae bacterium]
RNQRLLPRLRAFIAARGLDADLAVTEGPGHATELARDAVRRGCARVVAVGGDGTVNETAQALLHTPAALAIVPSGSGNGLARYLGLPASPLAALELATAPRARAVQLDAGDVAGRPFFNAMGIGLDAEISRRFKRLTRRGLPAYLRTGLAAFLGRRSERVAIGAGGRTEEREILIVAVANSDQYGNGAIVAPGARADDGVLDLVAVGPVGPPAAALLAVRLFLGTFDRSPAVRRLRSPRFVLRRPAPGLLHTDGEVHEGPAGIEVVVQPRSLRVLTP